MPHSKMTESGPGLLCKLSDDLVLTVFSFLGAKGYCIQPDTDAYPGNGLQPGHTWHRLDPVEGYEYLEDAGGVYCKLGLELWVAMYYWMIMLISGA